MEKLEQAQQELAEVEAKIEQLTMRRDALRHFIELGRSLFDEPIRAQFANPANRTAPPTITRRSALKAGLMAELAKRHASMRDRVIQVAEELIEKTGTAPTKEIVRIMQARGYPVTGDNISGKVLTASAILSRSGKFVADRASGWTLKEESKNP